MSMKKDFRKNLEYMLRAGFACVWVQTFEEERALKVIHEICEKLQGKLYLWDCLGQISVYNDVQNSLSDKKIEDPSLLFPQFVSEFADKSVLAILDFWTFIEQPSVIRSIKNNLNLLRKDGKVAVFVGPRLTLPAELDKDITVLDFPLPQREELKGYLDFVVESAVEGSGVEIKVTDETKDKLVDGALGLTSQESEDAFSFAIAKNSKLNGDSVQSVLDMKSQILRKDGILEYLQVEENMESIGGLDNLKHWLVRRKRAFGQAARNFGLPNPKGILLVGISGCGKSLTAKACASNWEIPLVRFDVGRVFNKLMGESEGNIRKVIQIAETMAPCVTGDTLIELSNGDQISVDELFGCENLNSSMYAKVYNPKSGRIEKSRLKGVIRKPILDKKLFQVFTQGGSIKITGNHKLWTNSGWKTADTLTSNDYIFFPDGKSLESESLSLPFPVRQYFSNVRDKRSRNRVNRDYEYIDDIGKVNPTAIKFGIGRGGFCSSECPKIPTEMSHNLSRLLGFINSEGWYSDRCTHFVNSEEDILKEFRGLVFTLFGIRSAKYLNSKAGTITVKKSGETITSTKDSFVIRVNNKLIRDFLFDINQKLLTFGEEYLCSYLSSFVKGDGHPSYFTNKITITQVKYQKLILSILRRLNIFVDVAKNGKNIEITSHADVTRLSDLIGLSTSNFKSVKYNGKRGIKPAEKGFFVKIEKVVPITGESWVYDLSLDDPHTYISNGMVSKNCVLWIDEAEKGLSGTKASGELDSGVTARVVGTILTWMQEKTAPVFVIATANDVSKLPPELLRKGRFDEIFFVDLPNEEERGEIVKIQLKKRSRELSELEMKKIVDASDTYTGAEIEQAVIAGLYECFEEKERKLTSQDVVDALKSFVPLSTTMQQEIDGLRDWGIRQGRARSASTKVRTIPSFLGKARTFTFQKSEAKIEEKTE